MSFVIERLLKELAPFLIKHLFSNRSVLIDFLKEEAKKTSNKIDDYVIDAIESYLNDLA